VSRRAHSQRDLAAVTADKVGPCAERAREGESGGRRKKGPTGREREMKGVVMRGVCAWEAVPSRPTCLRSV
jgi:hypothetical protein